MGFSMTSTLINYSPQIEPSSIDYGVENMKFLQKLDFKTDANTQVQVIPMFTKKTFSHLIQRTPASIYNIKQE